MLIVIEFEKFASVVLKVREWFELRMSCVAKAVACVMSVGVAVVKMLDRIPQARLRTCCKIACTQCSRLRDSGSIKNERAGCRGACNQLVRVICIRAGCPRSWGHKVCMDELRFDVGLVIMLADTTCVMSDVDVVVSCEPIESRDADAV